MARRLTRFVHWRTVALATSVLVLPLAARAAEVAAPTGATDWLHAGSGKLKARTFVSPAASATPILVVVLHGDAPFNKPDYQYTFAARAAESGDVVASAILRPGYTDPSGDTSAGERGLTTGDNYTRDRIDMVAAAIRELQAEYHASGTVLVGHSGGAAIAADLLALHPSLASRAVLASCPCDVATWRAHMKEAHPAPIWDQPVDSVSPLDVAPQIPLSDKIVMLVGSTDPVAPARFTHDYADALSRRGVSVRVVELPGKGHEILLEPEVEQQLRALLIP